MTSTATTGTCGWMKKQKPLKGLNVLVCTKRLGPIQISELHVFPRRLSHQDFMGGLFNYFNIWAVCVCSGQFNFDSWMIKSLWLPEPRSVWVPLRSDGATSLPRRGRSKCGAAATSFCCYLMCVFAKCVFWVLWLFFLFTCLCVFNLEPVSLFSKKKIVLRNNVWIQRSALEWWV